VAQSQRVAKKRSAKPKASKPQAAGMGVRPGRPRDPLVRKRVSISFDPERGRTHQSFKEECDINRIVETHANTGLVTHVARISPQYGESPDMDLFEAACVQAEIRSVEHDGWEPSQAPEEQGSGDLPEVDPPEAETPQAASQAAEQPTEG
jgi:hypothetical protein